MQAENIVALRVNADIQLQYGTIHSIDESGYQILTKAGKYSAIRAFSCIVEPAPGDKVMFGTDSGRHSHILSIIERPGSTDTSLAFPGNVTLNAGQGQLHLNGQQGICISSERNIKQTSEEYSVIAKQALFGIDSLTAVGSKLVSKINSIESIAGTVQTVADNLIQKLKNSFRSIDGVDQTHSRDVINSVDNLYSMRAKQAAILARKDIKIDAERIHMG